jgi:hypothetical protein
MNDRPCVCGCSFEDHAKLSFKDPKPAIYYCSNCGSKPPSWCYNFTPIGNLEYLEWKDKLKNQ